MVGALFGLSGGASQRREQIKDGDPKSPVADLIAPARSFYGQPPSMPESARRGAINNLIASGDQSSASRPQAGPGISSGEGQRYMQSVASGMARGEATAAAQQVADQDSYDEAMLQQYHKTAKAEEDRKFGRLGDMFRRRPSVLSGVLDKST